MKKIKLIGFYVAGTVTKPLLILLFILLSLADIKAQTPMSLESALVKAATEHDYSLLFDSDILPTTDVIYPEKINEVSRILKQLLKNTKLEFTIQDQQIFLFKRRYIYGYIEDESSREPLISSMIFVNSTGEFTEANDQGYFSLSTIEDSVTISLSYLGYKTSIVTIQSSEMDKITTWRLKSDLTIQEVLISDNVASDIDRKYIKQDKGSDILIRKNQSISAVGGEPDINQALIRKAGIVTGTDGIGGIHLRGGKTDQNLVLYDGVKMYNSSHALGVYSIFNSSIIEQARLSKSGSNGPYSGRLSSIVDVRIAEPDLQKVHFNYQASTLASQLNIETPIVKDKLGILMSFRRTHIDPVIRNIDFAYYQEDQIHLTNYRFYDFNSKINFKINERHKLQLSLYQGEDSFDDNTIFFDQFDGYDNFDYETYVGLFWKNRMASLKWNYLISNKTFLNVSVSLYDYRFTSNNFFTQTFEDEYSETQEDIIFTSIFNATFRADFETILQDHHLKYGLNFENKTYNPGDQVFLTSSSDISEDDEEIWDSPNYINSESTAYIYDKWKISESWLTEAAIYITGTSTIDPYELESSNYFLLHGYGKLLRKISPGFFLGTSFGRYIQTEHLISTSDSGFPNDVWVPSNDYIRPEIAHQLELFGNFKKGNHLLEMAVFYKQQSGLLFYKNDNSLPSLFTRDNINWDMEVDLGNANSYGYELDYSYQLEDMFLFHGAYTYGKTSYLFESINDGQSFPFNFSIPHTFSIGSNIKLAPKWYLSLDWFAHSGRPLTQYRFDYLYTPLELFESDGVQNSGINEVRLPSSHKLTINLSTKWVWGKFTNDLSFGVQNVYNRNNVIYQYEVPEDIFDEALQKQYGFPILPSFRYRIGF